MCCCCHCLFGYTFAYLARASAWSLSEFLLLAQNGSHLATWPIVLGDNFYVIQVHNQPGTIVQVIPKNFLLSHVPQSRLIIGKAVGT